MPIHPTSGKWMFSLKFDGVKTRSSWRCAQVTGLVFTTSSAVAVSTAASVLTLTAILVLLGVR
jgi:hypothetical protein